MLDSPEPVGRSEGFDNRAGDRQGHAPLDVGEGDVGLETHGFLAARVLGLGGDRVRGLFVRRTGGVRLGPALRIFGLQPGDQILERSRLPGEIGRALLLRAERVLGRGQRLPARVDERGRGVRSRAQAKRGSRARPSRSRAIDSRVAERSPMSRAMASTCDLRSGITAPRREAARTASAMSRGLTRIAGGGLAPMRWSAARTSAIASRRLSRERESASALPLRAASRSSAAASPRSASCTFAVVSISAAESRARSARIDSNCDSMARRWASDARIVSSTPRSSVSFSAFCCSIGGARPRGIGARYDRAAQGRAERGSAESQLQSSASLHHPAVQDHQIWPI